MKTNFYQRLKFHHINRWIWSLLFFISILPGWAQQSNLSTTARKPWTQGQGFSPNVTQSNTGSSVSVITTGSWSNPNNAVDVTNTNFAVGEITGLGNVTMTITQGTVPDGERFSAGNEVGFRLSLGSGASVGDISISTLNASGGIVETKSVSVTTTAEDYGFITTAPYTSLRIRYAATGIVADLNVYYAYQKAYVQPATASLVCNTASLLTTSHHPVVISSARTGGLGGAIVSGAENVIDNESINNSASLLVVAGTAQLSVQRVGPAFSASTEPHYVGFDIGLPVLGVNALNGITLRTYLQGVEVDEITSSNGLIGAAILGGKSRVGFVATEDFDEIQIEIAGLGISTPYLVYNAVVEKLCAGPALVCNVNTKVIKTLGGFPFSINTARTYIGGAVNAGTINNPENALDALWEIPAVISVEGSFLGSTYFSFVDPITNYPAGTFAGIEISNTNLLSASALSSITVNLYRDGDYTTPVQIINTSNGSLVAANSGALGDGRQIIGFIATQPFDEVELVLAQGAGITLGSTNVHGLILKQYCAGPALKCNTPTAAVTNMDDPKDNHPVDINSVNTGIFTSLACVGCNLTDVNNVLDKDPATYASLNVLGGAGVTSSISVKNGFESYPAGTYAGFTIANTDLLSLSLLSGITLTPYLNGSPTLQGAISTGSGSLLGGSTDLLFGGMEGVQLVGFVSTHEFDEVQITFTNNLSVELTEYRIHNFVVEKLCAGPELVCNVDTKMVKDLSVTLGEDRYPMVINAARTGTGGGITIAGIDDPNKAIDADWEDPVKINLTGAAAGGYAQISIMHGVRDYRAGTFAGIEISNTSLIDASLLSNIQLKTYLNGVPVETISTGNGLAAIGTGLTGSSRQIIGFIAEEEFDEVQLVINQAAGGLDLGVTNVYGLILKKFCEGPKLTCNTPTPLRTGFEDPNLNHPVVINTQRTSVDIVGCGACNLNNTGAIIDNNDATYATLYLPVSGVGTAQVSVKNGFEAYTAGHYAGFRIKNKSILEAALLQGGINVTTYLNGTPQESIPTGNSSLVAVSSTLLGGNQEVQTVGFITTKDFDEIVLTFTKVASIEISEFEIHDVIVQDFCEKVLTCEETYEVVAPEFPVIINSANTGVSSIACLECNVLDAANVLKPGTTDYANIHIAAGAAATGSISVKAGGTQTFPKGSYAGFAISDGNPVLAAGIYEAITITTYNNGVEQESKTGSSLLNLSLIIDVFGATENGAIGNVGFKTTLPFDEVQITVGSLLGALTSINVYGVGLDTRGASGDGLVCTPDMVPMLKIKPTIAKGPKTLTAYVDVWNLSMANIPSVGPLQVEIAKSADYTISFDEPLATGTVPMAGSFDNNLWTMSETSEKYIFTTEHVFAQNTNAIFKITVNIPELSESKTIRVHAVIPPNSGNDGNDANNTNGERIEYFK